MKKKIIVGVCGPARAGKNEISKYIEKYYTFHEDSFASPIRKAMIHILGLSGLAELDLVKDLPHPLLNNKTPRYAMQTMGTEWGRDTISDSLWIDSCLARISKYERAVISDVRFNNEAKAIKEAGGFIVFVNRPGVKISESNHVSESGIDCSYYDFVILNDGTIDDLYKKSEELVHNIFDKVY